MKWNVKTVVLMAASAALVAALVVWFRRSEPPQEEQPPSAPVVETASPAEPEAPVVVEEVVEDVVEAEEPATPEPEIQPEPVQPAPPPQSPAPAPAVHREIEPPPGSLTLRGDDKLATVNGVDIMGRDLMLYGSDFADKAQHVGPDAFDHLLNQAINRVLIQEAAESAGITLTDEQRAKLDKVAEVVASRREAPWSGNIQYSGTLEEQAAFEQREAGSQMLLSNLLAQHGIKVPDTSMTDDEVQSLYKERASEFGALPDDPAARAEAWKEIEFRIRDGKYRERMSVYLADGRKLVDELRSRAAINMVTRSE